MSVRTELRLTKADGRPIVLRGEYAAFTEVATLDMSVLGRDVTNIFAVIVDHPGRRVALLAPRHGYQIVP